MKTIKHYYLLISFLLILPSSYTFGDLQKEEIGTIPEDKLPETLRTYKSVQFIFDNKLPEDVKYMKIVWQDEESILYDSFAPISGSIFPVKRGQIVNLRTKTPCSCELAKYLSDWERERSLQLSCPSFDIYVCNATQKPFPDDPCWEKLMSISLYLEIRRIFFYSRGSIALKTVYAEFHGDPEGVRWTGRRGEFIFYVIPQASEDRHTVYTLKMTARKISI
jgi:hypothetical protein